MHTFGYDENGEKSMQSYLMDIFRSYTAKCFHQMMEMGIYPGQMPVLHELSQKDGISQRELARSLHVKPPTVNVTIQRLEKSGIVCRRQDANDQRVMRVYLTDSGKQKLDEAMVSIHRNEEILFGNFTEAELCLMRRFFTQIIENIDNMPGPSGEACMGEESLNK